MIFPDSSQCCELKFSPFIQYLPFTMINIADSRRLRNSWYFLVLVANTTNTQEIPGTAMSLLLLFPFGLFVDLRNIESFIRLDSFSFHWILYKKTLSLAYFSSGTIIASVHSGVFVKCAPSV